VCVMLQKHFRTHVMPSHLVCVFRWFHFEMYKTWEKVMTSYKREQKSEDRDKRHPLPSSLVVKSTKSEDDDDDEKGIS